jgi:hypothetical protein
MQGNSNMPVKTELLSGDQYFSFFLEENKFTNNKYHIFHCKSPLFSLKKIIGLKRAYLCQVSDTGSPEPLVHIIPFISPRSYIIS